MCNILGTNFLQVAYKKMPNIFPQRAEELFPALKESLVNVLHRKLIYQLVL
jgi:hypothetical protein